MAKTIVSFTLNGTATDVLVEPREFASSIPLRESSA